MDRTNCDEEGYSFLPLFSFLSTRGEQNLGSVRSLPPPQVIFRAVQQFETSKTTQANTFVYVILQNAFCKTTVIGDLSFSQSVEQIIGREISPTPQFHFFGLFGQSLRV